MAPPLPTSNHPLHSSSDNTTNNIPTNSDSSTTSHQHQNAMKGASNGARAHPPIHERSRNARAQARHRAKRKAYIEQLEETVARLQAALSPYPPFNTTSTSSVNGNASPNVHSPNQSSFGVSLSSPGSIPNSSGNALIGLGPSSVSGSGQGPAGGLGVDGSFAQARLRALELECNALRTYAETVRGMLAQHAPGVQIPPTPLPSSLPPSTMGSAASSSLPSLFPNANSNSNPNTGSGSGSGSGGALPPLNSSFPSFSSTTSASTLPPSSLNPGTYKVDPSGRVVGVKRPRRDSHSRSFSSGGSEAEEGLGTGLGDGRNVGYSTPNATPPLNSKSNAAITPMQTNIPNGGINSFANSNSTGRAGVPPLTLPPVPQSQPSTTHPNSAHSNSHPTPPPAYNYSNQSQQQLHSPHHPVISNQSQQQYQTHAQTHAHTSLHNQPQMTPMPPPIPWASVSSVPSHGNNVHAHGLQLPPPIPRFPGASMPNLTRSFAYPPSSAANASGAKQDEIDCGTNTNTERNRIGGLSGTGIGVGNTGGPMPLKREEDGDTGLATSNYGTVGMENVYSHSQSQRHAPTRHQQHESLHSISPTSATVSSPAVGYAPSSQYQQQHHTHIPSHAHQQDYSHQQAAAMQRPLPSPASHQHSHQVQGHYRHPQNQPAQQQTQTSQQAPYQHQHSATALPSPHSPYSPIGPNIPGSYRGNGEERYHHNAGQQHAHAHQQNQSQNQTQNQSYLWPPAHTDTVYGER